MSMCEVIVVDAESFRSTNLGRSAYMHDHCLGYHRNYLFFYQLPNSNLFTHRILFCWEKPLVKTMASRSIFYHILKPKIPCCNFLLFIVFCVFCLIYLSKTIQFNLACNCWGIDNPFARWVARICCLCAGDVYIVLLGSPTGLITLVS